MSTPTGLPSLFLDMTYSQPLDLQDPWSEWHSICSQSLLFWNKTQCLMINIELNVSFQALAFHIHYSNSVQGLQICNLLVKWCCSVAWCTSSFKMVCFLFGWKPCSVFMHYTLWTENVRISCSSSATCNYNGKPIQKNYTKKKKNQWKPQALFPAHAFTLNSAKLSSHTFVAEQILSAHFKSCVLHCEK